MTKVQSPVENFTGKVAGVAFGDGKAECDDAWKLDWFRRHGYKVAGAESVEDPGTERTEPESKFPKEMIGGWYELSDGSKVRNEDDAIEAEAKIARGDREAEDDESEFPKEAGGGWYELSDGSKVQGWDDAAKAEAKIARKNA